MTPIEGQILTDADVDAAFKAAAEKPNMPQLRDVQHLEGDEQPDEPDPGPGDEDDEEVEEEEVEESEERSEQVDDSALDPKKVLEELTGVLDEVRKLDAKVDALAKPTAEPEAKKPDEEQIPEHIRELLEDDDPAQQRSGKAMLIEHRRVTQLEAENRELREQVQAQVSEKVVDKMAEYMDAVSAACDPPLTTEEQTAVVDWMTTPNDRGVAPADTLTFDQAVLIQHPGRMRATNGKPTTGGTPPPEGAPRPVVKAPSQRPEPATALSRGGSAGTKPTVRKTPAPNESLEQAIARGLEDMKVR